MWRFFGHALVTRRSGCCVGLPFVPGCVWLQEYEGVKWRRTPGGQPIWLLCLECHHKKWPQDNRFRRVGVTPRFGKGRMCLGVLSSRVWLVSYEGRLCCEYGRTGAAKIAFLGQRSPRHLCRQWKVTRRWGRRGLVLPHVWAAGDWNWIASSENWVCAVLCCTC